MNISSLQLFLPLLAAQWSQLDINFIQSVIVRASRDHFWYNSPIFVGHKVDGDGVNHLIRWLHGELGVTSYLFRGTHALPHNQLLRNDITDETLSVLICASIKDPIWSHVDSRLRRLRQSKLIVILLSQNNTTISMEEIFKKLWGLQFVNVIVLHTNQIYGYTPYPQIRFYPIDNATVDLFPKIGNNLQKYLVSTPAENDLPRIFFVRNQKGERRIRGYGYRIFSEFLKRHNATLNVTNLHMNYSVTSNVNMSGITQLIGANELEISMHPYTGIESHLGILSYPLLKALNCLIVPVVNEIPRYMYLLLPFDRSMWLLLVLAVFYIALVLYFLSPTIRGNRLERAALSLFESLSKLLYLSSPTHIYAPPISYFLLAMFLFSLGFFTTIAYSNYLGSFLTAILVGKQVDSIEQLIEQKQHILSKHYEISILLQQVPPHLESRVASLVVGVNASEQVTALLSFNRSYAFPFTVERWQFFALQQQYANKPIYRYSSICFGAPNIGFPMRNDSHLESKLKIFIMWVQSTGLFEYWQVSDFKDALKAGYVHLIDNQLAFKPLHLDALRLAWLVLVCGWILAIFAYIGERLYV